MSVNLSSWVRRVPIPDKLRLDGKHLFKVGNGPKKWREALDYIESVHPSQVECLNAEGEVTRTTKVDFGETEDESDEKKSKGSSRDIELANIIMEAGDRGARRHAEAYGVAFTKMTDLVGIIAERLTGIENAWQETLENRAAALQSTEEPESQDTAGAMVGQLINMAAAKQQREGAAGSAAVTSAVASKVSSTQRKNTARKAVAAANAKKGKR
jgi:hypothetical protein